MKASKTFKFTKRNKTLTALLPMANNDMRGAFKSMMIQAQVAAETVIKSEKDKK